MPDSIYKINYREGELQNLLRVRDQYVDLIGQYLDKPDEISRSKMLGSIFDTVFFIGICNLRNHMPSMKEVYLKTGESRNRSLRNLELLEQKGIIERIVDPGDSRIKRVRLTEKFGNDFEGFVEQWVNSRQDGEEDSDQ